MSLLAAIRVALVALRLNALRSVLAMLGIIIGVASVIVMVSISSGAKQEVEEQIQGLGSNLLMLRRGSFTSGGRRLGSGTAPRLSDDDVEALRTQIPDVTGAAGQFRRSGAVVYGGENWTTAIYGIGHDYLEVRDWDVVEGRHFTPEEERAARKVVLLGKAVADELFDAASPVGATIRVSNVPFEVIGVLAEKGESSWGSNRDDVVMVPVTTARRRLFGGHPTVRDWVGVILIEVRAGANIANATQDIEDLMRVRRKIRPGERDDFQVRNFAELIETRNATTSTLSLLLASTAVISLIVGGIGIMNIMLVSVTERTREIGLRMAIGARRRDIRSQFLVESVTLCLVGGLAGLGLGTAGAWAIALIGEWPIAFDPGIDILALVSAAAVGVFFGFFPAQRAARLNPIDALRYE
jgi:putative ABC transport system permease protein